MIRVIELHEDCNTRPSREVWGRVAFQINDGVIISELLLDSI